MSNEVEQIKDRLSVAEIVGEYIKLEKSGVNYKALCPFHNEKTPSFIVNTERNFWYCFGCQEGGDVFSFVQKMEGLDFREALEKLAERANVELPKYTPQNKEEKNKKQTVLDILQLTTRIYQQQLIKNKKSLEILRYLKERGFTKEVIRDFKIGYAPDSWRAITNYLIVKKRFIPADVVQAGLAIHKDGTNRQDVQNYYDRFRDRVMFPIIDISGKTIGYSARIAPGGDETSAKYINSPQSIVYDKSKVLYGLYQARQAIRQNGYAIIVEGNADVVLSHSIGVKNVVAVSGTALTDAQVKILKRYTNKVMLNFDMDGAGQKATRKSIQVCLQNDLQVKVILLDKKYKDVGDIVAEQPDDWKKFIQKAVPIMEYYFQTFFAEYNVEDIQDRKIIIKKLLKVIKNIADPIEQSYWLKKLSLRTQTDEDLLTNELERVKLNSREMSLSARSFENKNTVRKNNQQKKEKKKKSRSVVLQQRLLGLLAKFREELKEVANEISLDSFTKQEDKDIFQKLQNGENLNELENRLNGYIAQVLYQYKEDSGVDEVDINPLKEWKVVVRELNKLKQQEKLKQIELDLKRAEENGDEREIERLMMELQKLLNG